MVFVCPPKDCAQCPRLVEFRKGNMAKFPTYYNGPVPPFGPIEAEVLIVGLAPTRLPAPLPTIMPATCCIRF